MEFRALPGVLDHLEVLDHLVKKNVSCTYKLYVHGSVCPNSPLQVRRERMALLVHKANLVRD